MAEDDQADRVGERVDPHRAWALLKCPGCFADQLSDEEVASVITYIRNSWGNSATSVSASEVRSTRQALAREKP